MQALMKIKKIVSAILMVSVSSQMGWAIPSRHVDLNFPASGTCSVVGQVCLNSAQEGNGDSQQINSLASAYGQNVSNAMGLAAYVGDPFLAAAALVSIATFNSESPHEWLGRVDSFLPLGGAGDALIPFFNGKGEDSSWVSLYHNLVQVGYATVESPVAVRNFLNAVKDPSAVALMAVLPFIVAIEGNIKRVAGDSIWGATVPLLTMASPVASFVNDYIYFAADGSSSVAMLGQPQVEWAKFQEVHNSPSASLMEKVGASIGFLQPLRFPLRLLSHTSLGSLAPTAATFRYEATLFAPLKIQLVHEMLSPYNQISLLPEEASSLVQALTQVQGEEILPALPLGAVAGAVVGSLSFALGGSVTIEPLVGTLIAPGNSRFAERVVVGGVSSEVMRAALGEKMLLQRVFEILRKAVVAAPAAVAGAAPAAAVVAAPAAVPALSYFASLKAAALALPVALGQTILRMPRAVLAVGAVTGASIASAVAMGSSLTVASVAGALPVVATTVLVALGGHLIARK